MLHEFFGSKKLLDRQVLDMSVIICQQASRAVQAEVDSFLTKWRDIGLADMQLGELTGMSYLIDPMNRGIHWDAKRMVMSDPAWKELFFHLIRTLLSNEYVSGHAEVKTKMEEGTVQTHYYAYLKPSIKYRARNPVLQLYGNMYVELDIHNDKTKRLKIVSNVYQGRGYVPAEDFEEFIRKIYAERESLG